MIIPSSRNETGIEKTIQPRSPNLRFIVLTSTLYCPEKVERSQIVEHFQRQSVETGLNSVKNGNPVVLNKRVESSFFFFPLRIPTVTYRTD